MYNRANFRDISAQKPREMSRHEWENSRTPEVSVAFYNYQSNKAKRFLIKFNNQYRDGVSEVADAFAEGPAIHAHHIFPKHQYLEISGYLENLIALTPSQHFTKAHPNGNTQRVDYEYQEILLKAKAGIIEDNLRNSHEPIYEFDKFIHVLGVGFDDTYNVSENDFSSAMRIIISHYMKINL